jgi:hypothetical protein
VRHKQGGFGRRYLRTRGPTWRVQTESVAEKMVPIAAYKGSNVSVYGVLIFRHTEAGVKGDYTPR